LSYLDEWLLVLVPLPELWHIFWFKTQHKCNTCNQHGIPEAITVISGIAKNIGSSLNLAWFSLLTVLSRLNN
jgi:hypothetical protein